MKKMLGTKKFAAVFSAILMFFFVFSPFAGSINAEDQMSDAPTQISSFDLFWPVIAGKARGDSLYFLKRIKENVRGFFIFGAPQKADYKVFLATKRVVEAEKLINENKKDLANATLNEAMQDLNTASSKVDEALSKGSPFPDIAGNIVKQADNISTFAKYMSSKNSDYSSQFDNIANLASSLSSKLK